MKKFVEAYGSYNGFILDDEHTEVVNGTTVHTYECTYMFYTGDWDFFNTGEIEWAYEQNPELSADDIVKIAEESFKENLLPEYVSNFVEMLNDGTYNHYTEELDQKSKPIEFRVICTDFMHDWDEKRMQEYIDDDIESKKDEE